MSSEVRVVSISQIAAVSLLRRSSASKIEKVHFTFIERKLKSQRAINGDSMSTSSLRCDHNAPALVNCLLNPATTSCANFKSQNSFEFQNDFQFASFASKGPSHTRSHLLEDTYITLCFCRPPQSRCMQDRNNDF